jgi:WD40 repeat protein
VAFSRDGHTLAAGSADGKVWLWNLTDPAHATQTGQPLTGPSNAVYSVAFSKDGHTLAAGSADSKVWLWNLTNAAHATRIGQPLIAATGPIESVAFSKDGHTLASAGSNDGMIRLWDLDVDHAIDRICATTSDNLTPAQWDRYISQLPYDPPCGHI